MFILNLYFYFLLFHLDGVDLLSLASSPIGRNHNPANPNTGMSNSSSHYLPHEGDEDIPYEPSMRYTEVATPMHQPYGMFFFVIAYFFIVYSYCATCFFKTSRQLYFIFFLLNNTCFVYNC